jgi:SAM-dependent methyltransferase
MTLGYDQSWHDAYGKQTFASANKILEYLLRLGPFHSVLDVGCGHGRWLASAKSVGARRIFGVDGHWTDRTKLLIPIDQFRAQDLTQEFDLGERFDLAICLEVGEHVASTSASKLVRSLVTHSDLILFGAAIPLQGGFGHINERWQSYWRDLFLQHGFVAYDVIRPKFWYDASIHYYYRQNMIVYVNKSAARLSEAAGLLRTEMERDNHLFDFVHPEKYELMASYNAIVLKRLLPKLPIGFFNAVRRKIFGI